MPATHHYHNPPYERDEFLVDGCPRCKEYVRDLGIHFDPERFRAFWAKMYEVEFNDHGHYASSLDKELGEKLYFVALGLQRAFGIHPNYLFVAAATPCDCGLHNDRETACTCDGRYRCARPIA